MSLPCTFFLLPNNSLTEVALLPSHPVPLSTYFSFFSLPFPFYVREKAHFQSISTLLLIFSLSLLWSKFFFLPNSIYNHPTPSSLSHSLYLTLFSHWHNFTASARLPRISRFFNSWRQLLLFYPSFIGSKNLSLPESLKRGYNTRKETKTETWGNGEDNILLSNKFLIFKLLDPINWFFHFISGFSGKNSILKFINSLPDLNTSFLFMNRSVHLYYFVSINSNPSMNNARKIWICVNNSCTSLVSKYMSVYIFGEWDRESDRICYSQMYMRKSPVD